MSQLRNLIILALAFLAAASPAHACENYLLADPSFPGLDAHLRHCCKGTRIWQDKDSMGPPRDFEGFLDPYWSGNMREPQGPMSPPSSYRFTPPENLEDFELGVSKIHIPAGWDVDRLAQFYKNLIPANENPDYHFAFIDDGGESLVSYFHPAGVPAGMRTVLEPKAMIENWLKENAEYVAKLLIGKGFEDEIDMRRSMPGFMQRHLMLRHVVPILAANATFDGKRFIEMAEFVSTPEQYAEGIVIQKRVRGVTVENLSDALDTFYPRTHVERHPLTGEEAKTILMAAGLITSESSPRRNREACKRMRAMISALEYFYRQTHEFVERLMFENFLTAGFSNLSFNNSPLRVAIDYNHGANVIWSPRNKMFEIIDF